MHGGPIQSRAKHFQHMRFAVGTQCSALPSHAVTVKPFIALTPLRLCFAVFVELAAPSPAAGLFLRSDISGHDINCNQKDYNGKVLNYCQVCGGLKQMADACK